MFVHRTGVKPLIYGHMRGRGDEPDDQPHQKEKPLNARSLDSFAEVYDRLCELTGQPLLDWLGCLLPQHGGNALDPGCGRHAVLLAERFDLLDLAWAKRPRPNVVYVHSDLRDITPERDGPFDMVLSVFALHHVKEVRPVVRWLQRRRPQSPCRPRPRSELPRRGVPGASEMDRGRGAS